MIWSISWKNVWRNKIRSLVVIIAVTLGIISGVLVVAIMEGWTKQRLHDAIYNEVSHIQVHNSEYLKNEEILLTVIDTSELINAIEKIPEIKGWVSRTRIAAMANTPWANTGVIIYGIDPGKEKKITEIYEKIVSGGGEYLDKQKPGIFLSVIKLLKYLN
jgi:putative ABC transport system permease protein